MHLGVLSQGQDQIAVSEKSLHLAVVEQHGLGRLRAIVRRGDWRSMDIGALLRLEMAREVAQAPSAVLGHGLGHLCTRLRQPGGGT